MTDFTKTKARFHIPEGIIYLDGNSLGVMPQAAALRAQQVIMDQWGQQLVKAWNESDWMHLPSKVGDRIARLIGAPQGSITLGDTLSIKVYQALAAALALNPERRVIISDKGNFPSDLYIADGLLKLLGRGYELKIADPTKVENYLDASVAVLMLTEVDYRTGRKHDMQRLTELAHRHGIITVWDLAHSAGAIPVDLTAAQADFAVGCTYKYLNGGPGAPAFIYVAPQHAQKPWPALAGWLGHEAPFAFDLDYRPAQGVQRMRVGTPPIIALSILDAALDAWDEVDMQAVRAKSVELSELFLTEVEKSCPTLQLSSPRDPHQRGSQISFSFEHSYAVMQALIAQGVIGDFRAPNIMRFGFTPLYIDEQDVLKAVTILTTIMHQRLWDKPDYFRQAAVT